MEPPSSFDTPVIIADLREKNSLVIAELHSLGAAVELKHLKIADYVINKEIAVERKTVNDFVNSMIDKRLVHQLTELKNNYKSPILILEKEDHQDIYKPTSYSKIHENAIRGMILSVAADFNVPLITTEGYADTAKYLYLLAKKAANGKREFSLAVKIKAATIPEQQRLIIESFPGIGPTLAKNILNQFKTIKNFVNSSLEELEKIPKLGRKKAMIIRQILEASFA